MLENYLVKGILVGLVFGVPAGAIGALTIQRTLSDGFIAGFAVGMGSSMADVIYACVGVFGITVVSDFLLSHRAGLAFFGGILIILLGILIFVKKAEESRERMASGDLLACFSSSFLVAMANPATILSFFVAFASFGISVKPTFRQGASLVVGILAGTTCWWGLLAWTVSRFRHKVNDGVYEKLNRALGIAMVGFGTVVLLRGFSYIQR